jgi:hypothetical protein
MKFLVLLFWLFSPHAETPTASPAPGAYDKAQTVTLSTKSQGAIICWATVANPTTNGAGGCAVGKLYTGPIKVTRTVYLRARAGGTGYEDSALFNGSYTIGKTR